MVGIPADQNSPKWGGWQAISEILHIEYQIVCCIEIYLIHIYHMSKCSKCNWNRYSEGFCMWNVHFLHKWVIPKYCLCYLNELTFNGNLFSFIELLIIFCAVFISYLMVINSNNYKSKYPNTIWWIMRCIMSELWKKKYSNKPLMLVNMARLMWKAVLVIWHPRSAIARMSEWSLCGNHVNYFCVGIFHESSLVLVFMPYYNWLDIDFNGLWVQF